MIQDQGVLLELAERCEKAEGPDRALDYDIAHSVTRAHLETGKAPAYTASIDAALTLVPEGWDWSAQTSCLKGLSRASCDLTQLAPFKPEDWTVRTARATTPALALCAAALRARAATILQEQSLHE